MFVFAEQARARLTPLERGAATREQAAAAANEVREAQRREVVAQRARQAPVLDARARRSSLHLPGRGHKRPREEGQGAPVDASPARRPSAEQTTPRSPRRSQGETQDPPSASDRGGAPHSGGWSGNSAREEVDFLRAGEAARLRLIRDVAETWGLRASNATGPSTISFEEIALSETYARAMKCIAERRHLESTLGRLRRRLEQFQTEKAAWGGEKAALESEKEELQRQLEEVQVKARADAAANAERLAKAEERAERRGRKRSHEEARDFFRKVLVTLTEDFSDDDYFNACLKYVEEPEKAVSKGRDPDEVEFPLPVAEDAPQADGDGAEATPWEEEGAEQNEGSQGSREVPPTP